MQKRNRRKGGRGEGWKKEEKEDQCALGNIQAQRTQQAQQCPVAHWSSGPVGYWFKHVATTYQLLESGELPPLCILYLVPIESYVGTPLPQLQLVAELMSSGSPASG